MPVKTDSLVVLVERADPTVMNQEDAERLGIMIQDQLKQHEVAPIVDSTAFIDMRTSSSSSTRQKYEAMTLADKAQAVHASQILYVRVDKYQVREVIGGAPGIRAHAFVRIVDAATGKDRWPDTYAGKEIDAHDGMDSRDAVIDTMATQISRMFYQWD